MSGFQKQFIERNGITVIRKVDPAKRRNLPGKIALVLAGGAISGGAYKLGGIRALNDFFVSRRISDRVSKPFSINDFDSFVGLSAGAIFASALAAGITPEECFRIIDGSSKEFEPFLPSQFMWPNVTEGFQRWGLFGKKETEVFLNWLRKEVNPKTHEPYTLNETLVKMVTVVARLLSTGIFDPWQLEAFLRRNLLRCGLPNNFVEARRIMGKDLYLTAVDINTGKVIAFGHDEPYRDVPITEAVVASCALPLWFRTVRLVNPRRGLPGERDFLDLVDGGVARTANVRVPILKGADLIVCYNPFRPISYDKIDRSLYEHGAYAIMQQLFRTLLGSRLDVAKHFFFEDPAVECDIIYIEPTDDDYTFFLMNPLNVWSRDKAAEHGFLRVKEALDRNFALLKDVFSVHGITLSQRYADKDEKRLKEGEHRGRVIQKVMESRP